MADWRLRCAGTNFIRLTYAWRKINVSLLQSHSSLPVILPSTVTRILIRKKKRHCTVVPKSSYTIDVPVFFGAALKDFICVPVLYESSLDEFAKGGLTIRSFDESDHWLPINGSRGHLNEALLEWVKTIEG